MNIFSSGSNYNTTKGAHSSSRSNLAISEVNKSLLDNSQSINNTQVLLENCFQTM